MKTVEFLETFTACDMEVGRSRQVIELLNEYARSMSFLDLGQT